MIKTINFDSVNKMFSHPDNIISVDENSTDMYEICFKHQPKDQNISDTIDPTSLVSEFLKKDGKAVDYIITNLENRYNNYYINNLTSFFNLATWKGKVDININLNYRHDLVMETGIDWIAKFSPKFFILNLYEVIKTYDSSFTVDMEYADDDINRSLWIGYQSTTELTFGDILSKFEEELTKIVNLTIRKLDNIHWIEEYSKNEVLFQKEFLGPLFRRMNFTEVIYTHGPREYGKDYVLSEIDKFGNVLYTAIQAKSGDIRSSDNKLIEKLVSQATSSFKIPYKTDDTELKRYTNKCIIAASGSITEQAKLEIRSRLPIEINTSLFFLGKNDLLTLLDRYI